MPEPKKRGRPATGRGVHAQVRLPDLMSERIDCAAVALGKTRPDALRHLIELGLKAHEGMRLIERGTSFKTTATILAEQTKHDVRRAAWDKKHPRHKDF